jgi:hypothetical protein
MISSLVPRMQRLIFAFVSSSLSILPMKWSLVRFSSPFIFYHLVFQHIFKYHERSLANQRSSFFYSRQSGQASINSYIFFIINNTPILWTVALLNSGKIEGVHHDTYIGINSQLNETIEIYLLDNIIYTKINKNFF